MAVSDLTNTKWLFNNTLSLADDEWHINFTSNNQTFDTIYPTDVSEVMYYIYNNYSVWKTVYDDTPSWEDEAYKTIEITGGTDVTNANLISWLEANATQQIIPTTKDITTITNYSSLLPGEHTLGLRATDSTGAYDDSTLVTLTFTKLAAPSNVGISGDIYSFDRVANAEEYDVYADNIYLGTVTPISPPEVVMGDGLIYIRDNNPEVTSYEIYADNVLVATIPKE